MTRPTKSGNERKPHGDFSDPKIRILFLDSLRKTMNQKKSCEDVDISYQRVWQYRKDNPDFNEQCKLALEEACEYHENILREQAFEGLEKHEFYKGDIVHTYREYNHGTAKWLLQVYNREKYCVDKQDINLKHSGGVLIIPPGSSSVEEWMEKNAAGMENSSTDEEDDKS